MSGPRRLLLLVVLGAVAVTGHTAMADTAGAPASLDLPVVRPAVAADSTTAIGPLALLTKNEAEPKSPINLVVLLTLASLAPAIILVCTCFTRFAVVFSFVRTGLSTQGVPPTQVLVGLALFMTMFVMAPVATAMYDQGLAPYLRGEMNETQAIEAATPPLRSFLLQRTRETDLELFFEVSNTAPPASAADVPLRVAVPAFVISELNAAFKMGLIVLLPFLVIDLIVASVLSALGMVMLPPPIVSLPLKLLVFVAIDGWHLVTATLLRGAMS